MVHATLPCRVPIDPSCLVALIQRSGMGDHAAFTEFHALTSRHVLGVVFRVVGVADLSAEVCQEVYLELWRCLARRYDPAQGSVLGWLSVVARRRAIDRVRTVQRAGVREQRFSATHGTVEIDEVWDAVAAEVTSSFVHTALGRLSPTHRDALVLFYLRGQTQREVASRMQIPLGTAKSRIRDALIQLRLLVGVEAVDLF